MKKELSIEKVMATSKNGRPYMYISIRVGDTELTRLFLKETEKLFFDSIIGTYQKRDN